MNTGKKIIENLKICWAIAILFSLFTNGELWGQTASQTFTGNGTFTVPPGITSITVEAWGAGGGGGGSSQNNNGGSGGGGGGYSSRTYTVTPGQTISYTAGAGGTAGGANGGNGGNGGATTITGVLPTISANGGNGGQGNEGTAGTGGTATGGTVNTTGGNGATGGNSGGDGGAGANGGAGGNGNTNGAGENGTIPGGGGGGGEKTRWGNDYPGGAGADGQVKFTYTPAYRAQFTAMNTGSNIWHAGETRIVTVTVTNTGQAIWTDAAPDINIGVKWNAEADYYVRVNAGNLTSGNSRIYSLNITAPSTIGSENLTFDVVNEADCWFGNNNGSCGPGNLVYTSPAITIVPAVYYSQSSSDPSVLNNWKTTGGNTPTNFTSTNQTFIIQNGHNMTTTTGWSVSGSNSKVQIQSGGILTENSAITLSSNTTLQIDNGGTLNHNVNSISIFGGTKSFGNTSTVNYGFNGVQDIIGTSYGNLTLAAGAKTVLAPIIVNTAFTTNAATTLNTAYNVTLNGTSTCGGSVNATAGSVVYAASATNVLAGTYSNLTTNSSVSVCGNVTVNGALALNSGNLTLNSYNLTFGPAASVSGTFSATRKIDIGTGSVTKQGNTNNDFNFSFPIGIGTAYTPVQIQNFSATGISSPSTIKIQSSASSIAGVPGTHPLNRNWVTSTTGFSGSVLADISFTYAAGDIPSGGTASLYEIVYKPTSGAWDIPAGAGAAGVNPLRASATNNLDAVWTATEPQKRIFYSLKSGSWDDWQIWTLDPSGTQLLNPNMVTPTTSLTSIFDEVVVLSGRTVTVPANGKNNSKLTVLGTLDFGSTINHNFVSIFGNGRIRLSADNFPSGDATDFISAGQGEGTVEYYGTARNLNTSRTFFNVEVNMSDANTLTLLKDYTINGNLTITNGIFIINNGSSTTPLNITVYGNTLIGANGTVITGSANARHQMNLYGDFTNLGKASFTNRTAVDFSSEATDGIVDVNFLNASKNQSLMCRGVTNFYRIEINKGTDYTYNLNIDATAVANFNLFGFANEDHSVDIQQLTDNKNALGLIRGSVRIGNDVVIPKLSVANVYCISQGAQLWVDRGTLQKNDGTDIAIYGKLKITNGLLEAKTSSGITFRDNGILSVEGGVINTNQIRTSDVGAANYGAYVQTAGSVNVLGGVTNTDYYVFSLPYANSVFNMSGGTLKVNTSTANGGILINSDNENIKVTGGTVIAETNSTNDFIITSKAPFWNLSLTNTTAAGHQFSLAAASNIAPDNINMAAQPLKVLNDFRLWGKESGGSAYSTVTFVPGVNDVYVGGSFYIEDGARYNPVSGGAAPYDAVGNQPTSRNTTYFIKTAATGSVEELYQGNVSNPLEFGNLIVDRTNGYEVKLTSGSARSNESVALDVNGTASVLSGTLNQNLYTIRTWGAIVNNGRMGTWYPGITPSRAQIQMIENASLTLTTSDNAVFGNVQINVTPPLKLTLSSDVYIERMEYVKGLIYLKGYNLKVDNIWNMETALFENSATNSVMKVGNNGYSGSSMIYTDGKASDGGLTIKVTANSQTENQPNILNNFGPISYPLGFSPDGGTNLYFRPAQVVVKNYTSPGYITIRPVLGALQTTNQAGGEVLQHYWRVTHSGFTAVPTVAYRFYYRNQLGVANVDLQTGTVNEASYVPGKVLDETPYTRQYEPLANNDVIKNFGTGNNSRFITINGTSTNGLFSPSAAGVTLENANYTAGVASRFTGSVLIYYSVDNNNVDGNNGAPWKRAASWTRSDILNTSLTSPHNSSQPKSTNIPGAGDVVVIGWVPWDDPKTADRGKPHCIWLTDARQVAEVVFTRMTDVSGNPVSRVYRSNFQFRPTLTINGNGDVNTYDNDGLADNGRLTAKMVKGEGLFWNRQSDPDYTLMDIGDFAREDSSYVIYENFTNNRVINNTPPLFPNIYISNDGWGGNDHNFTFAKDINTTGNVELLGDVNLLLPTEATGNFNVGRNLIMFENQSSGGGARIDFGNSGTARKIVVKGDLLMRNGNSVIQVVNPNNTAPLVDHELHIQGNIVQGTAGLSSTGLDLWSGANNDRITLYLDGSQNMTYNLVNGTTPDLYRLVVNKGISIETTAQFNCNFTLNGLTSGAGVAKALELQSGLFIVNNGSVSLNLTTGNDNFEIPSTAGLEMRLGNAYANGTSGIALDGLLRLSGGNVNLSGGDNPIVYSASGKASINVSAGTLTVGGQIRRSPTSDAGILTYLQTGGTVIAGNNAASYGNRGVFEILNAGSSFNMTGGDLFIARAQTSPTISAFYFNPETYNISTSANIHIGYSTTPASQTIGIYAGKPLPNLRINGSSTQSPRVTAKLEVVPATVTSLLQIDANTTFDANGLNLTLNGNFIANGTFFPNGNTTFLSGSTTQTITGNGSTLNFFNLDKTAANNVALNATNTPLLISNTLTLRDGSFTDNGNTITVKGDVLNNATHVNNGTGDGIVMNGDVSQNLSGNGTFGKLTINNPAGVNIPVGNQLLVTRSLKMNAGVLNIGKNLFDLGVNAVIEEASPFSVKNMVVTNISFTDNGLRKTFPSGGSSAFIYPVGSGDKYTPVTMIISANGNSSGSITVKPANEIHPSILEDTETTTQIVDKNNALQYYWTLKASGIAGFSAVTKMRYIDTDVKITAPYSVADYHTASLLANGAGNWLKFSKANFDETNKDLIFTFTSKSDADISGDYTAGAGDATLNGAIPDNVSKHETNSNGDWTNSVIWTPNVLGGPHGAIAKINTPHTVDVSTNYLAGYMTEIYGTLKLYSTYGHRLGIVNGTGTIYSEIGEIPAAVYDNFFSSAGGTLEFGGTNNYEFLGNITEVNHLKFLGTGDRKFPNNNLTLNGNMTIAGGASLSVINYYNKEIKIKGNLTRTSGSFSAGTGTNATLSFIGTLPQTITGSFSNSNALNNLNISNANGVTVLNDVEINRDLKLSNGLVNVASGSLFRLNYGARVIPTAGSASSFVNGVLTKELMDGNSFTFPIGNYADIKAYGPVSLLNVTGPSGINDWKASYFYANATLAGYNTESFSSPISTVSHSEYWKIEAPSGGSSVMSIPLDGSSDIASSLSDLSNLRVVGWNATSSKWDVVGSGAVVSGTATSGTITTTSTVNYGSYSYFTLASVTPIAASTATITSPATVNLCNGSSTTIVVTFTGTKPYVLTYAAGATNITTAPINASSYSITVNPSVTTIYKLLSVTANGDPGTVTGITSTTVNVTPIPTVILSSSPVASVCESANITFTASSGLTNYNFRVNGGSVQTGAGNTFITSTLLPGLQSVDVIGTNAGGCSATSSALTITVNPKPAAAGVIIGPASVCKNSTASFSVPVITNATSYTWIATNGATLTFTANSANVTFPNSGASVITVFGTNTCGNGNSASLTVAVNTASTPGAAGSITGVPQVCREGTGYNFSVTAVTNATSYIWSYSGTGATVNGTGSAVTLDFSSTATSGNLTVSGTNGCSTGMVSANYAIIVNPTPTASISPVSPSTCSSSSISITATPSGGTAPYTHAWTGTGASSLSSATIINPSFNNTAGGDYDLTYTVTDNKGCKGTATTSVRVFQAPDANAGPDATGLCTGASAIALTGATASGSYSGTPTWSGTGGVWTQNPDPALATFTPSSPSGTTTVTLTLTGANGCSNATDTRVISWNKTPDQPGDFTTSSSTICQGQSNVPFEVPASALATSYNWSYTGLGATISGATNAVTINFSSTASVGMLKVSATNSCGTSITRDLNISVNPAIIINSQSTASQKQCIGNAFTPISVSATGTGTLTYQWYYNTSSSNTGGTSLGSANGAQTSTYIPQSTAVGSLYYYCIVSGTCPSATSSISGEFQVYPLPHTGEFYRKPNN